MQAASVATASTTDFRFDHDDDLSGLGGAASRFKFNVAAIRLLKELESESREPGALTPEEQQTLARYTGWGDSEVLDRAFPDGTYSWSRPCAELEALLTPDEIAGLLASSLNAHYTALPIIRAVYAALDHYGIAPAADGRVLELASGQSVAFSSNQKSRLRILEPAAGIGHFLGAMPQAFRMNSERIAVEIDSLTGRIPINNLFIAHPEWMLGRPAVGRGMYGRDEFLLDGDGHGLAASLSETLIAQLPADGYRRFAISACGEAESLASDREDFLATAGRDDLSERDRTCVEELLEIYVAAKDVIRLQLGDASDEAIQAKQRELSGLYARFTMRFGPINRNVRKLHPHSPVVPFLKALEVPAGKDRYTCAPIFTQRTIRSARAQRGECSPKEALLISLNDVGRVDLDAIVRLCGQPLDAVLAALDGLIFETTDGHYVTAEEYLSGEVRQKLREAERAAQFNPAFEKNVAALRAVQPADLGRDEIIVRLGAAWVPETVVSEFVTSLVPSFNGTVRYTLALAVWKIEDSGAWARSSVEANQTWGTSRVNAFELIEDILNLRTTTVTDEVVDADGSTRRVVNDNETIAAQAKQLEIKQRFAEWVWKDDSREALLIRIYNERFNAFRKREYDGSHLVLPGMSAGITLYPHQRNAIWRILSDKATLLAHCVGAGKTFTMIAANCSVASPRRITTRSFCLRPPSRCCRSIRRTSGTTYSERLMR